ncbi:glycine cleavage system transcriptional antiactivator GcvR [Vibrio variabilis]|nr:glycine cleavage system transcriptional antiactivator GcvR [Vibrio variabilis]
MMKRTSKHDSIPNQYTVEVFIESEDRVGLTEEFTQFFADKHIGLASLSAQTIVKERAGTDTDQFQIALSANVDEDCNLMQLQEEFDALCNQLSVKGSLNFISGTH